ncbi:MAG: pitrilysin family protein [Bacteroidota bacterium]
MTIHRLAGRLSLALLLLALSPLAPTAPLAPEAQDFPSTPPAPGEPQPFSLPEVRSFTLGNGVEVTLVPYGSLPKVNVSATVRVGNVDEQDGQAGLADFAADLLTEGTATRSAEDIAREAAEMGGSVFSGAGLDNTTVGGSALSEFAPDLVRLLGDVLINPSFPEDAFARLKTQSLRGAAIARSQPGTLARAAFRRALYGAHPYATTVLPLAADIEAATLANTRAFYGEHFGPRRTRVYVSGLFDMAAVESAVRSAFGSWAADAEPLGIDPVEATGGRRILLVDQPGAAQSNVIVGLPTISPGSEQSVALDVTNALLGGSFGSRITRNIREDKGYTYSPSSSVSGRIGGSYWAETAAIQTPATGPAIREILHEIDSLATTPPPAEELRGIQNYLAGTFVLQNSSASGVASYLRFLDSYGIDRTYLETYVQTVYAVTPEDVRDITRDLLHGDNATIVVVGDASVVEPQLAEIGEVTRVTLE